MEPCGTPAEQHGLNVLYLVGHGLKAILENAS